MAKGYKDLNVWQKAIDFVDDIYRLTDSYPKSELYRLTDQILRAAISIPSNIAEGSGRESTKEFMHFINIAKGSLAELETQLIISQRRKYINDIQYTKLSNELDEIDKMLFGLKQSLKRKVV